MSSNYPRGSEWRKWDLHLHAPGTKLSDGYKSKAESSIDDFCDVLEKSDVEVFGITDYFSLNSFFSVKEAFYRKYPNSRKVLIPNLELRLNESVNPGQEEVNIHLLFEPDLSEKDAAKFLGCLKTEISSQAGKVIMCSELSTLNDFQSASVTRGNISEAIKTTYGENVVRQDHVLIVTASNNDGLRPKRGVKRKEIITDRIDLLSDGFFGGSQNTKYYLNTARLESDDVVKAKPVYACSDSHSFEDLDNWLGKETTSGTKKEVTWVKANPTFTGLQQTLIEPSERVRIQATEPDAKETYKRIERVDFSGTDEFPSSILFNGNLCSIIGSRSSGKSALLAYMAYSIDPDDTLKRQKDAADEQSSDKMGPAAGKTWSEVSAIQCKVIWASGEDDKGKVIYIPQNYLYSISKRPEEINKKIKPVLFAKHPAIKAQFDATNGLISQSNSIIRLAVSQWLSHRAAILENAKQILNLGDKKAIKGAKQTYDDKIKKLRNNQSISKEDSEKYQRITLEIAGHQRNIEDIEQQELTLSQFLEPGHRQLQSAKDVVDIDLDVNFSPDIGLLPLQLLETVNKTIEQKTSLIISSFKKEVATYSNKLSKSKADSAAGIIKIREDNKGLIEKNKKNNELATLIDNSSKQAKTLAEIEDLENKIKELRLKRASESGKIEEAVKQRHESLEKLEEVFTSEDQGDAEIQFELEQDYNPEQLEILTDRYNKVENSPYINKLGILDVFKLRGEPDSYLEHMASKQKIKSSQSIEETAIATMTFTEDIRFSATLEGDIIGGFSSSSMTPGKQALFALTLILNESDDVWPLLIDQPEDDLDSRSIYEHIVPYLVKSKTERQILMVSHDANLVVGADSEQLIVANRHGDDRKNRDDRKFDYLTGSIEDSRDKHENEYILESCGLREHAIEILDGGKEAFAKRKDKYKI